VSILERRRKCFEEHFQPHDGIQWCEKFGYAPRYTSSPSEFVALAGIAAMANGQLEAWNAALDHDKSILTLIEQNRELLEALQAGLWAISMSGTAEEWAKADAAIRKATGEEA
ncbi:hypothetical protein, partial [Metapseudomonas otitidis]|uniref:hypothetical protein n=1 Tax=Metapseudomonas otitidis TaxID=319939 RepID=UPI00244C7B09